MLDHMTKGDNGRERAVDFLVVGEFCVLYILRHTCLVLSDRH